MRLLERTHLLVAILVCVVAVASQAPAAARDVNTWGYGWFDSSESGGDYTYTWSVTWDPALGDNDTDGLTWYLTALEFQPDGNAPPIVATLAKPAGWTDMVNPNDGWLSWYANDSGHPPSMTTANGLLPGTYSNAWSGTFTPTGPINPANFQLLYTAWDPASGHFISNRASLMPIPEPATMVLLLPGLLGLGLLRRRK